MILYTFKETSWFTKRVTELLTDEQYAKLQFRILEFPDAGKVIKGSGGIRKLRVAVKDKGRRGGARVIYYVEVGADEIYMLTSTPRVRWKISAPSRYES